LSDAIWLASSRGIGTRMVGASDFTDVWHYGWMTEFQRHRILIVPHIELLGAAAILVEVASQTVSFPISSNMKSFSQSASIPTHSQISGPERSRSPMDFECVGHLQNLLFASLVIHCCEI
jgi:hypothetical protein